MTYDSPLWVSWSFQEEVLVIPKDEKEKKDRWKIVAP